MVELPTVRDQPGCGVEDRLQFSHDNVCGTVIDTVTIIDTTLYMRGITNVFAASMESNRRMDFSCLN